ncbi:MAG: HAD-IIIA family hydrolase [Lentisphaerae bacterium]|jgi:D-glycero-D-manno-heptose 1,7-bisphosphate phosphatase|nr:HAD-IIIA family hydrolase [Lentisphaerota bacterium]MBT4823478.1 HAD-IIIA family hydrolase [Lentisphaerota bacterium]MBT5611822.1 HAD-IIIA family hydrolase [Lentisphaerota bacterium]MBT7059279.1 HAD-IIIA family hydrolase [Lentisphaerota bacterium]MBT7843802.1 HAD-IIIA family hydrolase [Lentisphaerota bacterium]
MSIPQTAARAAIFLDRDGTIIEDGGFLTSPEEVVFIPGAATALLRLQEQFALFIVTHQVGMARGIQTAEEVERVNRHILDVLGEEGVVITEVYCCPHERSEGCQCIKPNPFFPNAAARDYGVTLEGSFSIGDHLPDVELAQNVGGTGIFVLTGHGDKHRDEVPPGTPLFENLTGAADWILNGATPAA